jgi:hypothetical protein
MHPDFVMSGLGKSNRFTRSDSEIDFLFFPPGHDASPVDCPALHIVDKPNPSRMCLEGGGYVNMLVWHGLHFSLTMAASLSEDDNHSLDG